MRQEVDTIGGQRRGLVVRAVNFFHLVVQGFGCVFVFEQRFNVHVYAISLRQIGQVSLDAIGTDRGNFARQILRGRFGLVGLFFSRLNLSVHFIGGDPLLSLSIPVNPSVARHLNFIHELQVNPIQALLHRCTLDHVNFGFLDALRAGQAGVRIHENALVIGRSLHSQVVGPVATIDRVPRVNEKALLSEFDRAAGLVSPADGVRPKVRTADAGCQVVGHAQPLVIGLEAGQHHHEHVSVPRSKHLGGLAHQFSALFNGIVLAGPQFLSNFKGLFGRVVGLPQGHANTQIGVEEAPVGGFIARNCRVAPATNVEIPSTFSGIATKDDRAGLITGLVLAIYGKARFLQLVREQVANLLVLPKFLADEEMNDHRLAVHVPNLLALVVLFQFRTQGLHPLGDHLLPLGGVVMIFRFQRLHGVDDVHVVRHVGRKRGVHRGREATLDVFSHVFAIQQPMQSLADLWVVEGVETFFELGGVDMDVYHAARSRLRCFKIRIALDLFQHIGVGQRIGVDIHVTGLQPSQRLLLVEGRNNDLIHPSASVRFGRRRRRGRGGLGRRLGRGLSLLRRRGRRRLGTARRQDHRRHDQQGEHRKPETFHLTPPEKGEMGEGESKGTLRFAHHFLSQASPPFVHSNIAQIRQSVKSHR